MGDGLPTPVRMTAQQDLQQMMDQLKITSIRPGVSPKPGAANPVNYDQSKANPYPNLPDPLVCKNGQKVTSEKMWWDQRRPEIAGDFDREVYGRVPPNTPKVTWEVTATTQGTIGQIAVVTKQLVGLVDNATYPLVSVTIHASLTLPADARAPVPVIVQFQAGAPPATSPAGLASLTGKTGEELVLARGWGYAMLVAPGIQADNGGALTDGIIGLMNKGQPRKPDDWGALRAWAWGASRLLDYLETDKSVDAKHVGISGHSRYGKAALVTMANDPRFAIAYISSSGEGGSRLHRRHFGEDLENLAGAAEHHWMAGNFIKYASILAPNDLPVDSHELIALCAPRPVFLGSGATPGDGWADAKGTFLAGVGAGPVYELLGKKGLGTSEMPPLDTPLLDGEIAFRQHPGGHTDLPNWPTFLTFAARYLK